MPSTLTVGQISAIINACLTLIQVTLPLVVVVVLAGFLERNNTAITWSVVNRMLERSYWPSILFTDSAATDGVRRRVIFLSKLSLFGVLLLYAAGILTPLGIVEGSREVNLSRPIFKYTPDNGPFGLGTSSRSSYTLTRLCGVDLEKCPGQTRETQTVNETFTYHYGPSSASGRKRDISANSGGSQSQVVQNVRQRIGSDIPQNITEVFTSSGDIYGPGVANLFQIQFRNYLYREQTNLPETATADQYPYTIGKVRLMESIALNDRYEVLEGLIVDTREGGIGFRNHTMPENVPDGATWEEDLLWMEPVTDCVNNNITLEVTVDEKGDGSFKFNNEGGFRAVGDSWRPSPLHQDKSSTEPNLLERAFNGAFFSNLQYVTSAKYSPTPDGTYAISQATLPSIYNIATGLVTNHDLLSRTPIGSPVDGASLQSTSIDTQCRGFSATDSANITNISVQCGLVVGTAVEVGSAEGELKEEQATGSWRHPIYTCATAVRASIKRVGFAVSGTTQLANLNVTSIKDIQYPDNAAKPIWAVEKTGMQIQRVRPCWGLVNSTYEHHDSLWVVRSGHLYLPAGYANGLVLTDSLAGAGFYQNALLQAYSESRDINYQGTSYRMRKRWANLSRSAEAASLIPNLIWTDIMANVVLGTRSIAPSQRIYHSGKDDTSKFIFIEKTIKFNYYYAIPAAMLVLLWVVLSISALALCVCARVTPSSLRQLLNQTATGRVVSNLINSKTDDDFEDNSTALTKDWIKGSGRRNIGLINLSESSRPLMGGGGNGKVFFTSNVEDKDVGQV